MWLHRTKLKKKEPTKYDCNFSNQPETCWGTATFLKQGHSFHSVIPAFRARDIFRKFFWQWPLCKISPNLFLRKFFEDGEIPQSFRQITQKMCGYCPFPQNFHTKKLKEISVIYVVDIFLGHMCEITKKELHFSCHGCFK